MKSVTVVMSTYNGSKYLREQIESVVSQKNVDVSLFIRDDGSTDDTQSMLEEYRKNQKIEWYCGRNLGAAYSFFDALTKAPNADYYAFCDQDDIWDGDKLSVAVSQLEKQNEEGYAIYCCGSRLVDKDLNFIKVHKLDTKRSLSTRLILAYVSGNTIVINHQLKEKIIQYKPLNMVMHDAWCMKVAICLGADVIIDPEPHISYRQHEGNVVGMETSFKDSVRKFNGLIKEKDIYKQLIEIKNVYANEMTPEFMTTLQLIENSTTSIRDRIRLAFKRDINFYNVFLNLAFRIKVLTKNFA